MSKLSNFKNNEIENAGNLKGGVFCEWYINQRNKNPKNAALLMEKVDGVMIENGNQNFA